VRNQIIQGDALAVLRQLPDTIAQCCVTSPPYWGLRDYGVAGQIGLEQSTEEFITRLVAVFSEVRRVLRPDGVLWVNMGDSYAGTGKRYAGYKPKDLMMMPARLVLALQADGWIVRADCIWARTNAMPEPVRDRPAKSHEYVFLLAKSQHYFYDVEATRQPLKEKTRSTWGCKVSTRGGDSLGKVKSDNWAKTIHERKPRLNADGSIAGAAMRSVWNIAGARFKGAHLATFPPKLIEPYIMAGSKPGDLILDPFLGSGTTAIVAQSLGRDYLGIELNPAYIALAQQRIAEERRA
jgi:DNA modification methylase